MDWLFNQQLRENGLIYKRSLDRIVDKYSKLQYQDGAIEVDLGNTNAGALDRYMKLSRAVLDKLDSKSLTDLRDESLRDQDTTQDSQLYLTHQDSGADDVSVTQLSMEDDEAASSDTTRLTVSSSNQSLRNVSETELQPEDQDEELEMSLRSHSSSLVELYPRMISRIGKVWHRQHVSEAADSVLRRYRRWRQQSNRSFLGKTFNAKLRRANGNPRNATSKTLLSETSDSLEESQCMRAETTPRPPFKMVSNLQRWQAPQQQSPGRVRGSLRREQQRPILVMDFSDPPETFKTKEISLNKTFTVSEVSQLEEQPSMYAVSPSRSCYPTAEAPLDRSLRSKRFSLAARPAQTNGWCSDASQTTAVRERPDIYGSPVRQSPSKARMMTGLSRSPLAFSRSPRSPSVERFSREHTRSTSLSSPPPKPTVPLRMPYSQDSRHSLQPQLCSPQPRSSQPRSSQPRSSQPRSPQPRSPQPATAAEGPHTLRRQLSFDSSVPSSRVYYSRKKLDEDFIKLYHKFVCQNKSSVFEGVSCRYCGRNSETNSETNRRPFSSSLAALALSPHCAILRKRHRELSLENHPQSKRSRDEYCASSPGSKRHGNETLRRRLLPSEYEQSHQGPSGSPSKHSTLQRFSTQQRSADSQRDTRMSRGGHGAAADSSGLGSSFQSNMANGSSPRKW